MTSRRAGLGLKCAGNPPHSTLSKCRTAMHTLAAKSAPPTSHEEIPPQVVPSQAHVWRSLCQRLWQDGARDEYVTRHQPRYEAILREFMADGKIATNVISQAHALVITNKFKVGFFLGVEDGYGVIMVKKANGSWSVPVIVTAGEASLGFQIGADASEAVWVITDDTTPKKIFDRRFNVGLDAKAVAGPSNADAEKVNRKLLETPVIVYSTARGLYAGANVKSGWLERNDRANFILYSTSYTMPELLYSDWVKPVPEVGPLMDYVKQIAP